MRLLKHFKLGFLRSFKGYVHQDFDLLLHYGAILHSQIDQIDGLYVAANGNDGGSSNGGEIGNQGGQSSQNTQNTQNTQNCHNKNPHLSCSISTNSITTLTPPLTLTSQPVSLLLSELLLILPPHHYTILFSELPQHVTTRLNHLSVWQSLRGTTRDDEWCWMIHDMIYPNDETHRNLSKINSNMNRQRLSLLTSALFAHIKLNLDGIQEDYELNGVQDDWLLEVINTEQVTKLEPF